MKTMIQKISKLAKLVLVILLILPVAWFSMRVFFFDRFMIYSCSMAPTLMPGDRILVDKTLSGARIYRNLRECLDDASLECWRIRGRRDYHCGDVVVFNNPIHNGKIGFKINDVFCKRIVALPGDSVCIRNAIVQNNHFEGDIGVAANQYFLSEIPDSLIPPELFRTYPNDSHFDWNIKNTGPLYVPRKGDLIHLGAWEGTLYRRIIEWETGSQISSDWDSNITFSNGLKLDFYEFKNSYYYMCGDNSSESDDSRYWGFVPEDFIVGIVTRVISSREIETGKLVKDRLMKKI